MKLFVTSGEKFRFSQTGIFAALLFGLVLVTFWPVAQADFVQFDDDINVYRNQHIRELSWDTLKWMFTDVQYTPRYRPLNWLAWAVLYHFFGANGPMFHLFGLILHGLNAVLLFYFTTKLFALWKPEFSATARNGAAAAGSALWALHPLRAETVGWVNCEMFLQSFLFLLACLICYLEAVRQSPRLDFRCRSYWFSVFFFGLSSLTYPTAMGVVPVLLFLDYGLKRFSFSRENWFGGDLRRVLVEKIPFAIFALGSVGFTLWARTHVVGTWEKTLDWGFYSNVLRVAQACYIWTYYLWKSLVPADLSPVYTQLVEFNPVSWPFIVSAVVVTGVSIFLARAWRRLPFIAAFWFAHMLVLIPVLGLTDHPHYPSDRYSYVAGGLWAILIAPIVLKLWERASYRTPLITGVAALSLLFSVMSFRQVQIWKDTPTLFQYVLKKLGDDPYRADIAWRLGTFYLDRKEHDQAISFFKDALQSSPNSPLVHYSMGIAAREAGRNAAAIDAFREAVRLNPNQPVWWYHLAELLEKGGNISEAAAAYRRAVDQYPRYLMAILKLGWIRTNAEDPALRNQAEALQLAQVAVEITKQKDAEAFELLATAYAQGERFNEAVETAEKALQLSASSEEVDRRNRLETKLNLYKQKQQ